MDDVAEAVPVAQHLARLGAVALADPKLDRAACADQMAPHREFDRGGESDDQKTRARLRRDIG